MSQRRMALDRRSGAIDRLRGLVRLEDALLFLWLTLLAPLLVGPEAAASGQLTRVEPLVGLFYVAAAAGALAMLALRPPGGADIRALLDETRDRRQGTLDSLRRFPLLWASFVVIVAIAMVLDEGLARLGIATGEGLYFLLMIVGGLLLFASRWLPVAPVGARRLLVTPFVLVAAGMFDGLAGGWLGSVDAPGLLAGAASGGEVALVLALTLAVSAPFYALLVFAPRQLADPEGSALAWIVRYGVFLAGVALGIDWLSDLGR